MERVYSTIQRNKEHGWSGDKTKQKSLMRTLALNFLGSWINRRWKVCLIN